MTYKEKFYILYNFIMDLLAYSSSLTPSLKRGIIHVLNRVEEK